MRDPSGNDSCLLLAGLAREVGRSESDIPRTGMVSGIFLKMQNELRAKQIDIYGLGCRYQLQRDTYQTFEQF